MNSRKTNEYNSKLKSITLYSILLIIFMIIAIFASIKHSGYPFVVMMVIFYWAVATLPLYLTRMNWVHPSIFQMLFEIPRVISIACRATGYMLLNKSWVIDISLDSCTSAYIHSIFLSCIGLLIEYIVIFGIKKKYKRISIWLKHSGSAFILIFCSFVSFLLLMKSLGGIINVLIHYQERLSEFSSDTNLYLRYAIKLGVIAIFYYYLIGEIKSFLIALIIQIFMYLILGERGGLITILILPFFIAYQLNHNRTIKLSKIILGCLFLVIIYESMGLVRDVKNFSLYDLSISSLFSGAIDTIGNITHGVISAELVHLIDIKKVQFTFGIPLLRIFVAPFPRSMFPLKPKFIAESAMVGSLILDRNYAVYGMPPGVFAYGYLNFGFFGVILFAIICGYTMKKFYGTLIEPYWKKESIPNGNILIYSLLVESMYSIISTEVQINIIIFLVGFIFIEILARKKIKR